jgi:hypothetical protein
LLTPEVLNDNLFVAKDIKKSQESNTKGFKEYVDVSKGRQIIYRLANCSINEYSQNSSHNTTYQSCIIDNICCVMTVIL